MNDRNRNGWQSGQPPAFGELVEAEDLNQRRLKLRAVVIDDGRAWQWQDDAGAEYSPAKFRRWRRLPAKDASGNGWTLVQRGDVLSVDLDYPPRPSSTPRPGQAAVVEIGICDVRAADSIRVRYDFDRDGYVIEQAAGWCRDQSGPEDVMDWREVHFVKAWARVPPEEMS